MTQSTRPHATEMAKFFMLAPLGAGGLEEAWAFTVTGRRERSVVDTNAVCLRGRAGMAPEVKDTERACLAGPTGTTRGVATAPVGATRADRVTDVRDLSPKRPPRIMATDMMMIVCVVLGSLRVS